ncbi:MAG TPA: hypothetical protein DHW34_03180 [Actinobacteria bacterium]|nr:hypothetical protein [Actinomycetota bacterium]
MIAEFAFALPAAVLVTAFLVMCLTTAAQVARCHEAAVAVARAIARGESPAAVASLQTALVPRGARITSVIDGQWIQVAVQWQPPEAAGRPWFPPLVTRAVAIVEQ